MLPSAEAWHGILLGEVVIDEDFKQDDECWMCHGLCVVTWNKKYHGWMGYCPDCDTQWRLS